MSRFLAAALGSACALLSPAAAPASAEEQLHVSLVMPTYGRAVFGPIEVEAVVYPPTAEVDRVELYLDDELVELVERPPYKAEIDVGQDNVEHRFVAVVYDRSGRSARAQVETPRITTDAEISVELVQLFVTVDQSGRRRLDLGRDDFAIFDNGARQELVTFEKGEVPFTAVLLLDASSSMQGRRLEIALRGAESFVEGMTELDQAKLMLFADRLLFETPFTNIASVVTLGLGSVEASGGTALNDYLYLGLKRLAKKQGRRVAVILSDGIDVESVLLMEQVRWIAAHLRPVVYWIRPEAKPRHLSTWRGPEEHDRELEQLEATVAESGGRIRTIRDIEEVPAAFRAIQEDLRNQYVLGYYPSAKSGEKRWHEVDVRVRDGALAVRTRTHYAQPARWKAKGGR